MFHARLVAVILEATSPASASNAASRVVAEAVGGDACSIYVRRGSHRLELTSQFGPPLEGDELARALALADEALHDVLPKTAETSTASLVAVPVASVNQAIGAVVVHRSAAPPFASEEIMRLSGLASQIVELLESLRLVEALEGGAMGRGPPDEGSRPPPSVGQRILEGIAVSPGVAIGVAMFRGAFPRALLRREAAYGGADAENARVRDAVEKTRNDLLRVRGIHFFSRAGADVRPRHRDHAR